MRAPSDLFGLSGLALAAEALTQRGRNVFRWLGVQIPSSVSQRSGTPTLLTKSFAQILARFRLIAPLPYEIGVYPFQWKHQSG
jgi:hypothetical protein